MGRGKDEICCCGCLVSRACIVLNSINISINILLLLIYIGYLVKPDVAVDNAMDQLPEYQQTRVKRKEIEHQIQIVGIEMTAYHGLRIPFLASLFYPLKKKDANLLKTHCWIDLLLILVYLVIHIVNFSAVKSKASHFDIVFLAVCIFSPICLYVVNKYRKEINPARFPAQMFWNGQAWVGVPPVAQANETAAMDQAAPAPNFNDTAAAAAPEENQNTSSS